jgi:hypothetical protein
MFVGTVSASDCFYIDASALGWFLRSDCIRQVTVGHRSFAGHGQSSHPPERQDGILALKGCFAPEWGFIGDLIGMDRSGSTGAGPFALAARCRNCMSGPLSIVFWLGLVLIGIAAMQWGAARAADLLDILRGHWGLPATAGST